MLGNSNVHPVLLSTALVQTREFYHDKLGLDILAEDAAAAAGLDPGLERTPLELKGKRLVTKVVTLRVDAADRSTRL